MPSRGPSPPFDPARHGQLQRHSLYNADRKPAAGRVDLKHSDPTVRAGVPTNFRDRHAVTQLPFNDFKTSTNSAFSTFNPELNSSINFSVTQPLLRGRGVYINMLPVTIARSRLRAADYGFQDQLIQLLAAAESAYWDVVGARENLRVQQESLQAGRRRIDARSKRAGARRHFTARNLSAASQSRQRRIAGIAGAISIRPSSRTPCAARSEPTSIPSSAKSPLFSPRLWNPRPIPRKWIRKKPWPTALHTRPDLKNVVQIHGCRRSEHQADQRQPAAESVFDGPIRFLRIGRNLLSRRRISSIPRCPSFRSRAGSATRWRVLLDSAIPPMESA